VARAKIEFTDLEKNRHCSRWLLTCLGVKLYLAKFDLLLFLAIARAKNFKEGLEWLLSIQTEHYRGAR